MFHDIMLFLRGYCGHHTIHFPTQFIREYQSSSNAFFTPNQACRPLI